MKHFKLILLFCVLGSLALGQELNIDTQVKGSRWPAFGVDSGAANAYAVATGAPLGPSLRTGSMIMFIATHANTTASTLAVNGGSAKAIKKNVSSALTGGEIPLNGMIVVYYDGTNFQLPFSASTSYILQVNAVTLTAADTVNFNDSTPAAGSNGLNVKFQKSTASTTDSVSAYVPGDGNSGHWLSGVGTWTAPSASQLPTVTIRRTCMIVVGADNGAALVNADLGPQLNQCFVPYAATVVEIEVMADAGTPNVIVQRSHLGTPTALLSGALATASAGAVACSNTGGTTGLDATTTCTNTLQNTSVAVGDWIGLTSGTAGATAKRMSVAVTMTVN